MRRFACLIVVVNWMLVTYPAQAQPRPSPARAPAAAEILFRQGRDAMNAHDYNTACAKFAESQRLDPAAGTAINLAMCEEQRGRIATAWQSYQDGIDRLQGTNDERLPYAIKRAKALEQELPHLTIRLAPTAPLDASVSLDGVSLGTASLNTSLPLDPGKHIVVVTAAGHDPSHIDVHLKKKQTKVVTVNVGTEQPSFSHDDDESTSDLGRTLGFVAGGIGIASFVVAGVTGVVLLNHHATVKDHCDSQRICDTEGAEAAASARGLTPLNTASWIVGFVGVGAGAILLVSSGQDQTTALQVQAGPNKAALSLVTSF